MPEVVSIASVWRDRARVAEEAAAELDGLIESASILVGHNYLGVGCVEGEALFDQLRGVLDSWCDGAVEVAHSLVDVALNCSAAADSYEATDGSGEF